MNTFFKNFFAALVLIFSAASVFAQNDDYYKIEGFGGYAYMNLDRGVELNDLQDFDANRKNSHGFNGSVTYNFTRNWGAKFDVSLHTYGEDFESRQIITNPPQVIPGVFKISQSDYQFMGGIQWKDNRKEGPKFKPSGHVLAGVAHQSLTLERTAPTNVSLIDLSFNDFAMKFGGGVDIKIHKNVDVRVFQFDFNPIWRGEKTTALGPLDNAVRSNYMITFGVAIH